MKGLIFTYGMTGGGALAGLLNPFYGLLVYISFAIIKPDMMWPWAVPEGRYSLIVALSMLIGWSISRRANFKLGKSWIGIVFLEAFLAWAFYGALEARNQWIAWEYVEILAKIAIPVFIGLTTIDSTARLKQLAWTIVIAEGYVAYEMNSYYFSGYNLLRYSGFGALDNNSVAIGLVTGLGVAFFLALHSKRIWQKGLTLFLALMMGHAVLFSFSRGGMLAMTIMGVVSFIVIPKRPRTYAMLAAAVCVAGLLAGAEVRERFMTMFTKSGEEREVSAQSRVDLWTDCWDVMKKNPVFGCGPNHWPMVAPEYGWNKGKEAHSLWLQTGAELGFTGVFLLLGFYISILCRCWVLTWRRTKVPDPFLRVAAQMTVAGLAGFIVSAQFVSLEALEIPYYVALLGMGALKLATEPQPVPLLETEFDPQIPEAYRTQIAPAMEDVRL
jgi:probable O-glycosylation ligase (exosortase A-associated)